MLYTWNYNIVCQQYFNKNIYLFISENSGSDLPYIGIKSFDSESSNLIDKILGIILLSIKCICFIIRKEKKKIG